MTLRHLKIYIAVYQTENITKAAEQLYLSQPAVTRAIQEIENYYGIRLFERIGRRLRVTETGKVFYNYALHIVDSFDQMEKGLRNWDELGVIRVGTSITLGSCLLPKVLTAFRKEHPSLQIRSSVFNGTQLQQALLDNKLDFAVIECGITDENLCCQPIAPDCLVPVLPPDDPRAKEPPRPLKDYAGDSFLLRESGSMGRTVINRIFANHGVTLTPVLESVSTQAIIRAVHEGLGVSFLPKALVEPYIRSGFVSTASISDESFLRENVICWHRQKFLTNSARELMDCFRRMSYGEEEEAAR